MSLPARQRYALENLAQEVEVDPGEFTCYEFSEDQWLRHAGPAYELGQETPRCSCRARDKELALALSGVEQ